jgi:hypothetical protein
MASALARGMHRASVGEPLDLKRHHNRVAKSKVRETISAVMRRQFFANLIPYLVMLALVVTLTVLRETTPQYHMDASCREIFLDEEFDVRDAHTRKNFADVRSMEEFWQWVHGPLSTGLFPEKWYNGQALSASESSYLAHTNKLIGGMRLRQLRVPPKSCPLRTFAEAFASDSGGPQCHPGFTTNRVDTAPFGPGAEWKYMANTGSYPVRSTYSNNLYTADGHVIDISLRDAGAARDLFRHLEDNFWIDLQTRAVFVNINLYNPNTDVIGSVQLMIEFLESGDVGVDTSRLRFIPTYSFTQANDIVTAVLEGVLLLVLIYQARTEWREMWIEEIVLRGEPRSHKMSMITLDGSGAFAAGGGADKKSIPVEVGGSNGNGNGNGNVSSSNNSSSNNSSSNNNNSSSSSSSAAAAPSPSKSKVASVNHLSADSAPPGCFGRRYLNLRYFTSVWNWVEMTNLLCFAISFYFKLQFYGDPLRRAIVQDAQFLAGDRYFNLETLAENFYFHEWFWSVNILLTGMQFFKYVRLNKQLSLMWQVVALALTRILTLTLTLVVMLMSFSLSGYVVFGRSIHSFRNIQISVSTCSRIMFGEFDYNPLTEVNRYLTPLFFWVYVILSHLLLLNLFIAVLATAYDRIARDEATGLKGATVDYGMLPALQRGFRYVTRCDWYRKKGHKRRKQRTAVIITDDAGSTLKIEDIVLAKLRERHLLDFSGPIPAKEIIRDLAPYMIDVGSDSDDSDSDDGSDFYSRGMGTRSHRSGSQQSMATSAARGRQAAARAARITERTPSPSSSSSSSSASSSSVSASPSSKARRNASGRAPSVEPAVRLRKKASKSGARFDGSPAASRLKRPRPMSGPIRTSRQSVGFRDVEMADLRGGGGAVDQSSPRGVVRTGMSSAMLPETTRGGDGGGSSGNNSNINNNNNSDNNNNNNHIDDHDDDASADAGDNHSVSDSAELVRVQGEIENLRRAMDERMSRMEALLLRAIEHRDPATGPTTTLL